jgi:hypothetical protein
MGRAESGKRGDARTIWLADANRARMRRSRARAGCVESLERRVLLATDIWSGASSSSWSDSGNWSLGAPPGTGDVAEFDGGGGGSSLLSVTLNEPATIDGLQIESSWDGTLTLQNALAVGGTSQLSAGTIDVSSVTSGSTTITGSLTNTGTMTYSAPTALGWDAAGTLTNKSTLDISAGSTFALLNGGILKNSGTINDDISGSGFEIDSAAALNNNAGAIFSFGGDSNFGYVTAPGTFNNLGTLKKIAGTGTSELNLNFSNQGGTINVASGTIEVDSVGGSSTGGSFTVATGAVLDLTGGQSISYSGSYTGTGTGTIALDAGTLDVATGGATFNFAAGLFQWSGGAIDTSGGELTNTGTIALSGGSSATETLQGTGVLVNQGTIDQSGAGTFDINGPATLNNQTGTFDITANSGISESGAGGSLDNGGTIEKTAGTGTFTIDDGIRFSDTGTVYVQTGTLDIENATEVVSDGALSGGTWNVGGGATLDLGTNVTTLGATVDLQGPSATFGALASVTKITSSGALDLSGGCSFATAGSLDNAGTISLVPGTLNVSGALTQESTGSLDAGVGGTLAGSQFGQIVVSGSATLSGTLTLSVLDSFAPALGQSFTLLSYHSESGTFSTVTLPTEAGAVTLNAPSYGATALAIAAIKNSSVTVTSSANPANVGQSITLTAKVQPIAPQTGTPTGSVTFLDGSTTLKTVTLSGGSATYTTSTLAVGPHQITIDYSGDPNFAATDSAVFTQAVLNETQTTLKSSVNPTVYGESAIFFASVSATASGAGTPTGSVTFMNGSATIQTVALADGTATCSTSSLRPGSNSITAVYSGSSTFETSTSPAVTQTVNPANSTVSGSSTSTPNPPVFGQSITLLVSVTASSPGSGTPTGGLAVFKYGSTELGSSLLQEGTTSIKTSALPAGTDVVTVQYQGDPNFKAGGPTSFDVTVDPAATTTTLEPAGAPTLVGQQAVFTAKVAANSPGSGTVSGTVSFYYGSTLLGTTTMEAGSAIQGTYALPGGSDAVTAVYNGSSSFAPSAPSAPVTQTVNPDGTSTALSTSGSPSAFNEPVTFTATVTANAPGGGTPGGSVSFMEGSTALGTVTLQNGSASYTTSTLTGGAHTITAEYLGNSSYTAGLSNSVTETIGQVGSNIVLKSSAPAAVYGEPVTFTATVTPNSGRGAPAGTVTFTNGSTVLAVVSMPAGVATYTTSTLALGGHSIAVSYAGSTDFSAASVAPISQSVSPASTVIAVSASANPGIVHQFVTITAMVLNTTPGAALPVGTVTFKEGKKKLLTTSLSGGMASLVTKKLALGANKITVIYSGNADFRGSTSAVFKEVIKNPPRKKGKRS